MPVSGSLAIALSTRRRARLLLHTDRGWLDESTVQVVLASGEIVNANSEENPNLALKEGSDRLSKMAAEVRRTR